MSTNPIAKAITLVGLQPLAAACGVRYQAVRKWEVIGLPRTEHTGETQHAENIERATGGQVTKAQLLAYKPLTPKRIPRKRRSAKRDCIA